MDLTASGLKTDYRSAALQTALPGPARRICIHVCICVCVLKCVRAERACMYVGDGRTDWMEGLVNLNVCMCVRA